MDNKKSLFHAPKVKKVDKRMVWPMRLFELGVASYFLLLTFFSYSEGVLDSFLYGTTYSKEEDSVMFWLLMSLHIMIAVGFIWQTFKIKPKT